MTINKLMLRVRNYSESIRRETTDLNYALKNSVEVSKSFQKVLQTHTDIWRISGEILLSCKRRKLSRSSITLTPVKSVHLIDSFSEFIPPWTEIMERIGSDLPPRSDSRKKLSSKKFNSARLRKMLNYDAEGRCINAFRLATSTDFLKLGYEIIKSKPGNMVRGSDSLTLDGIPLSWFTDTSKSLREESYVFKPARRVYIPKPSSPWPRLFLA